MILEALKLSHFRNYSDATFRFDPKLTYIIAPNGKGKTNLLEAITFMCSGKGIKESKQSELIEMRHDNAEVRSNWKQKDYTTEFSIVLKQEKTLKKAYFIDKAKKGLFSYAKHAPSAVLFTPDMIAIIDGSPSKRRRFIDSVLTKLDLTYKKKLTNYEQGVRKRNKVLEAYGHKPDQLAENIAFWNEYLINEGSYIQEKRTWLTQEFNKDSAVQKHSFTLTYEPNIISEERFAEYTQKEKYQRRTLIGPLRDDFAVVLHKNDEDLDTRHFVSRGEQRLALFWLILRNIHVFTEHLEYKPILLLDDIFSELDEENREIILHTTPDYQTIVTATDDAFIQPTSYKGKVVHLEY